MRRASLIASIATTGVLALIAAHAQSGGSYRIDSAVIAGGGATLDGGAFRLSGTVGQPATASPGAAGYVMHDGFWTPAALASDDIFMNGFDP